MTAETNRPNLELTISEHGVPRRVTLDRPIVTIGKLSTSTITLTDPTVSRRHCVIECSADGQWQVTDLGSTHGTRVNGERTVQGKLSVGDRVVVGQTTIDVTYLASDQPDPEANIRRNTASEGTNEASCTPARRSEELRGLGRTSFFDKRREVLAGPPALDVALLKGDTLLVAERFAANAKVTIGGGEGCDLFIPAETLGRTQVSLVRPGPGGPCLDPLPGSVGDLLMEGELSDIGGNSANTTMSGGGGITLSLGAKARMTIGDYTVLVGFDRTPAPPKTSGWGRFEWTPLTFVLASAMVHFMFLGVAKLMPEDPLSAMMDPDQRRERLVKLMRVTPEPEARLWEEPPPERDMAEPEEQAQLSLEDGQVMVPEKPAMEALLDKIRQHRDTPRDPRRSMADSATPSKRTAKQIAQRTGAVGALTAPGSLMKQIMDADPTVGTELAYVDRGGALSAAGLDAEVFGPGGGGEFEGFPSLNGPGPGCANCNNKPGPFAPIGRPIGRKVTIGPKPFNPKVIPSSTNNRVSGARSKASVGKRIRRYLSGLRSCLSTDIQAGVAESGRTMLSFKIAPGGKTFTVKVSGAGTPQFKQCAKRKVTRWRFGDAAEGGITNVSYPVILKVR